jgi:hypothetical protein
MGVALPVTAKIPPTIAVVVEEDFILQTLVSLIGKGGGRED